MARLYGWVMELFHVAVFVNNTARTIHGAGHDLDGVELALTSLDVLYQLAGVVQTFLIPQLFPQLIPHNIFRQEIAAGILCVRIMCHLSISNLLDDGIHSISIINVIRCNFSNRWINIVIPALQTLKWITKIFPTSTNEHITPHPFIKRHIVDNLCGIVSHAG